jgi:hypothetical protein
MIASFREKSGQEARSGVADHRIVSADSMSRGASIMDDRMIIC